MQPQARVAQWLARGRDCPKLLVPDTTNIIPETFIEPSSLKSQGSGFDPQRGRNYAFLEIFGIFFGSLSKVRAQGQKRKKKA